MILTAHITTSTLLESSSDASTLSLHWLFLTTHSAFTYNSSPFFHLLMGGKYLSLPCSIVNDVLALLSSCTPSSSSSSSSSSSTPQSTTAPSTSTHASLI